MKAATHDLALLSELKDELEKRNLQERKSGITVCAPIDLAIEGTISSGLPCRTIKSNPRCRRLSRRSATLSIMNCARNSIHNITRKTSLWYTRHNALISICLVDTNSITVCTDLSLHYTSILKAILPAF